MYAFALHHSRTAAQRVVAPRHVALSNVTTEWADALRQWDARASLALADARRVIAEQETRLAALRAESIVDATRIYAEHYDVVR